MAKEIFRADYRLYSGALIDVVYDHFLASDKEEFPGNSLYLFSQTVFAVIDQHEQWLPEKFTSIYPFMKAQNWLFHYRTRTGTRQSLAGLVRRAAYLNESDTAYQLFEDHYQLLHDCYRGLWKDLKSYARRQLDLFTNDLNEI